MTPELKDRLTAIDDHDRHSQWVHAHTLEDSMLWAFVQRIANGDLSARDDALALMAWDNDHPKRGRWYS